MKKSIVALMTAFAMCAVLPACDDDDDDDEPKDVVVTAATVEVPLNITWHKIVGDDDKMPETTKSISLTPGEGKKFDFELKDFVFTTDASSIKVGNIKLTAVEYSNDTKAGYCTFTADQKITPTGGDLTLNDIPVKITNGKYNPTTKDLYVDLTVDLGQMGSVAVLVGTLDNYNK